MRVHFTPVTVFFWLLLLAVTIVHVFFYQRFGQDHKLEIFGIEIGIVLAIFGLMGTESLQWWCHRLFGVRFGDFRNYIRASVFGVGGAGKSSLINSAFMNQALDIRRTKRPEFYRFVWRANGEKYNFLVVDYPGRRHRVLRELIQKLGAIGEDLNAIIMVLSFFPAQESSNDSGDWVLNIPEDAEQRKKAMEEHVAFQFRIMNPIIQDELLHYSSELHSIFVIYNQINLLDDADKQKAIQYSRKCFEKLIAEFKLVAEEKKNVKEVDFIEVFLDAKNGLEYLGDSGQLKQITLLSQLSNRHRERHASGSRI